MKKLRKAGITSLLVSSLLMAGSVGAQAVTTDQVDPVGDVKWVDFLQPATDKSESLKSGADITSVSYTTKAKSVKVKVTLASMPNSAGSEGSPEVLSTVTVKASLKGRKPLQVSTLANQTADFGADVQSTVKSCKGKVARDFGASTVTLTLPKKACFGNDKVVKNMTVFTVGMMSAGDAADSSYAVYSDTTDPLKRFSLK